MKVIEVFLVIVAVFVHATLSSPSKDTPKWSATLRRADGIVEVGTVTIEKSNADNIKVSGTLTNLESGKYVGVMYPKENVHSICERTGLPYRNGGTWNLFGAAHEPGKDFSTKWGPISLESELGKKIVTSYLFIYSMSSEYNSVLNALLNETNTMEAVACGEFRKITSTTTGTTKAPPKTTTTTHKTTSTPPKTTTTPPTTTTIPPKKATAPSKTTTTPPRVVPKITPLDDPKDSPTVSNEDSNLFERVIDKWHTFRILWVVLIAVLLVCCCWDRRCRCARM